MSINGGFPTGAFCIYSEPGKIFVGTAIGVWVSTNSGANWFKRDNGLGADPYVFSFVKVNNTLFAATNNWVYKTTNDGLNWILTNFSGQTFQDVDKLLYYNNKLYAAAYTGIWVNTDDIVTGIENPSNEIPAAYKLLQNYPNPFNPSTKIEYQIPSQSNVILKVYDFTGKEVQTLVNEIKSAGKYSIDFNASSLSSGVYFYKLETTNFSSVKKMTVIK
ncbi:MAG: T9SS type A sorting domain-containing protein [Ignavibacteria bacterium]|nr:T9SS type A sorting domain-containing protein [Ignavibacteria bacterium]